MVLGPAPEFRLSGEFTAPAFEAFTLAVRDAYP
jgi:hypothetical protein